MWVIRGYEFEESGMLLVIWNKDWQYNMTSVRYCSFDRDNSEVPIGNQFMETLVKDPPGVGTTCMGDYDPG